MPYQNQKDFEKDFNAAQDLAIKNGQTMGGTNGRVDASVGWNAYVNSGKARSGTGLMLFGRHVAAMERQIAKKAQAAFNQRKTLINEKDAALKASWTTSKSTRIAAVKKMNLENFDLMEAEKKPAILPPAIDTDPDSTDIKNFGIINNDQSGSILLMGNSNWNFTINDTWLLGAVHYRLPFYPASNVSKANIFDDKHILTITGRELFGLALFGYVQESSQQGLGSGFRQSDVLKSSNATLLDYQTKVSALASTAEAARVFSDAGFRISEFGF